MSFDNLLQHTITIYNKASRNRYGRESYGTGTIVNARVEQTDKTIFQAPVGVSSQGVESIPINAIIFVPGATSVEAGDKISTVATDEASESISYKVMRKHAAIDGRGVCRHIELECQLWVV